ncbi:protein of unknown function [Rhodovastum atsumiense]|uniref:hypothetical protein n=1 Tax=Rhodovastum atsumiense TaxID=504468 RepID=UPI00139F297B|nr:hypothetical protein [Rhodovastum atsumiense]CAH2600538.1 protein of unknown function [Rhodovastum atsumiense]
MTYPDADRELSYESMLTDPLIRLVMDSDGVTPQQLRVLLEATAQAVAARKAAATD